jgi:RNA polymerase sigma-70 factor (ECF subfamily)
LRETTRQSASSRFLGDTSPGFVRFAPVTATTAAQNALASMGEAETASRALAGDREAWDALIATHNARLVAFLVARGRPLARAKELAHDTWIRLISQQREGKLASLKLPALAFRQAAWLALDDARRERGVRAWDEAEPRADDAPTGEAVVLSREQLARVRAALASCSAAEQRVFSLLYEHPELSHREAAHKLGLSEQRVRQVACGVRKRLRTAMEE